jgi:hypothetical protein
MAPARAACAWRSKTRDDGAANAAPHVREYIHLRKVLSAELNVAASKKQSHAMTVRAMRRSVPEGALTRALDEEDLDAAPEEFYAVTFTNPERRAVVARARGVEDVASGDESARARVCREASTMTSDAEEVEAFLNASATRFHRAAQTYAVAGDAFDAGDFNVKICRVETSSGRYIGTILDLTYYATNDASTAETALREYAAHASAAANAAAESEDDVGAFVLADLRASCPADVYAAPAGDLQCAISYVDALHALRR